MRLSKIKLRVVVFPIVKNSSNEPLTKFIYLDSKISCPPKFNDARIVASSALFVGTRHRYSALSRLIDVVLTIPDDAFIPKSDTDARHVPGCLGQNRRGRWISLIFDVCEMALFYQNHKRLHPVMLIGC